MHVHLLVLTLHPSLAGCRYDVLIAQGGKEVGVGASEDGRGVQLGRQIVLRCRKACVAEGLRNMIG